ncbi:hypothetical protein SR39_26260 [Methylobacterium radiotolerans]|nr:hypothetical protein A3862_06825 [Methylobacterium sp. XJLW]KIU28374.1 hypothetical protein SR39_26260 [Methylobacterium radiotolerans]
MEPTSPVIGLGSAIGVLGSGMTATWFEAAGRAARKPTGASRGRPVDGAGSPSLSPASMVSGVDGTNWRRLRRTPQAASRAPGTMAPTSASVARGKAGAGDWLEVPGACDRGSAAGFGALALDSPDA